MTDIETTTIEITNKFTGARTFRSVPAAEAFKALNHIRASWNVSRVRFV